MNTRDKMLAAFVATVWGLNFVVSSVMLRELPPFLFTALRFLLVAFPAIFFVKRPTSGWRNVVAVGVSVGLFQFGLMFWAMHLGVNPGLASLLIQLVTIFTLLLAVVILKETPSRVQIIGVALGLVGLVIIALGRDSTTPIWPILMVLAAALGWATGNIVMRRSGEKSGISLSIWSALVPPIPMLIASLLVDGPHKIEIALGVLDWRYALGYFFSSIIATLVGFGIWANLLRRNSASTVAPWSLVTPPVGMLSGWVFLGQQPTMIEWVGAVVILTGVLFAGAGRVRAVPVAVPPG